MNEQEYKSAVLAADKQWLEEKLFRGTDYSLTFVFEDIDYSAATFAAQLRLTPDAAGDPIVAFTVSTPTFSGGDTTVVFTLTDTQTDALPAASETGKVLRVYGDFKITIGGLIDLHAAGAFDIIGKVTP